MLNDVKCLQINIPKQEESRVSKSSTAINMKMTICGSIFSALNICMFLLLPIYSEKLPSDNNLTLENKSCNDTEDSDVCTNASDGLSIEQVTLDTINTTSNIILEGDYTITSDNTTAVLETDLTTPAAEDKIASTTVETTFLTNSTTAALTTRNITQENGTTVTNATVETTTSAIETATAMNASIVPETEAPLLPTDSTCSCDLTMNLCDNNCCCDSECSREDRLIFSSCYQKQPFVLDPRYCYQTQFIYHNNTEMKMAWFHEGLFCILEDNLPVTVRYKNRKKVASLKEFNSLHESRKTFAWPMHSVKPRAFRPLTRYAAGDVVWSLNMGSLQPLGFPIKVANVVCQTSRAVHFLQDYASSCSRPVPNPLDCETNENFSAAFYYRNISIIAKPESFNQTEQGRVLEQCSNTSCVSIIVAVCPQSLELSDVDMCTEPTDMSLHSPKFNSKFGVCHNVVQRVRYLVYHNGTKGLTKVYAYITLANISLSSRPQEHFNQHFGVEFRWSYKQKIFKRSGRPGYMIGKPVMAGRKIVHVSKEENGIDNVGIELSNTPAHWLSITAAKRDGTCDLKSRQPVTFGDNNRATCLLPVRMSNVTSTLACGSLQNQILTLLSGDAVGNITEAKQFNRYVATFGDSRVEDVGDWVQVLMVNLPGKITSSLSKNNDQLLGCKSVVTGMHVDIVFANVGALANPQAKILGVAFTYGNPRDLLLACRNARCSHSDDLVVKHVQLLTSVAFVDVTQRAETRFSEPPVYEVKLAYDFFYPFFSGADTPKITVCFLITALVILIIT